MPIVISSIPLRVGGKRIQADTPVEISDADAESLSDYITIVTDAVQEPIDEDTIDEEPVVEESLDEEPADEESAGVAAPRGRGRPSRAKQ